jgi:hypothetical protein
MTLEELEENEGGHRGGERVLERAGSEDWPGGKQFS